MDAEVTWTRVPTMPVRIAWTIVPLAVTRRGMIAPFPDRRWGVQSRPGAELCGRHLHSKSDPAQKIKTPGLTVSPRPALVDRRARKKGS